MIPLRLSIEGVHSYQKKQEIDFEHLTAAGLFGIFGKVGSGKSTILEAITVVLYGQNDRFSKPERSYNLTNLRSNHFNISFDFMTEANQFKYRFEMTGTRNSKKFEDITVKRAAYQWQIESNTWMPIADINAERILDLKYNDFKRTIIIPQGKFQEFLEMNATERTAMMQHLFKLDKYDLADKTTNLSKLNDLAISSLEGELLSLGTASPEEFTAKTKDLHQATTLLQTYETETKQLREHALAEETLKKLFDDLLKATQQLEKLDAQQGFFEKREKELHDFQAALLHRSEERRVGKEC